LGTQDRLPLRKSRSKVLTVRKKACVPSCHLVLGAPDRRHAQLSREVAQGYRSLPLHGLELILDNLRVAHGVMTLTVPAAAHMIGRAAYFIRVPLWTESMVDELWRPV
jgi:hypothetical protein